MNKLKQLKQLKLQSAVALFEKEMKAVTGGNGSVHCTCNNGRTFSVRCNVERETCCRLACDREETGGSGYGD